MDDFILRYTPRIRELLPGVDIHSIVHNREGLVNDIFIINSDTVVRFAKDEYAVKSLRAEVQMLDLIRPHVKIDIPDPFYVDEDVIVYRLLEGETLSRMLLRSLGEVEQRAIADQLGGFLWALHIIPVEENMPTSLAPATVERWSEIRTSVEREVYPLLLPHQIEWARHLFDSMLGEQSSFDYEPCAIHGDLGSYHILFDRQMKRINGVIDFGVSGVGDPATDLGNLLQVYGESFVSRILRAYPQAEGFMKRARFYAQAIELQWVLSGITSGERFWFTAHLGGARDIDG